MCYLLVINGSVVNVLCACVEHCQAHIRVAASVASDNARKSSRCLGAEALLTLLGNYCHSRAIKTSITIGVVGKLHFIVSDIAVFVLKRDVKLQLTNQSSFTSLPPGGRL